jgi:hypothetical protein
VILVEENGDRPEAAQMKDPDSTSVKQTRLAADKMAARGRADQVRTDAVRAEVEKRQSSTATKTAKLRELRRNVPRPRTIRETSPMKEDNPWRVAAMILLCAAVIAIVDYVR